MVIFLILVSPSSLHARVLAPPFSGIQLLVELLAPPPDQQDRDHRQGASEDEQAAAHAIVRLLARGVKVRAEPVAGLADAVGNGNQRRLLGPGRRHHRRLPRELQVEAAVGTADEQDDAKVAGADVERADEDAAARGREDDGDDDVQGRLHVLSAGPGDGAGRGVCNGIGGCLDEVGCHLVKAESIHNLAKKLAVKFI